MKYGKSLWLALPVVAIMWLVAAWYYPQLPETVPIHWNSEGQADNYMDKPWGVLLLPLISTGVLLLLIVLPKLSPKGFRLDSAGRAYGIVVTMVMVFMLGILVLSYEQTLGRGVAFELWVTGSMGLLFLVLGNYLGKFPKNFWVGIRTPWTLSSDEVWFKTHRFAGRTFMAGGLLIIITAIAGLNLNYIVGITLVAALSPVLYSLILYKRLHGFNSPRNE